MQKPGGDETLEACWLGSFLSTGRGPAAVYNVSCIREDVNLRLPWMYVHMCTQTYTRVSTPSNMHVLLHAYHRLSHTYNQNKTTHFPKLEMSIFYALFILISQILFPFSFLSPDLCDSLVPTFTLSLQTSIPEASHFFFLRAEFGV